MSLTDDVKRGVKFDATINIPTLITLATIAFGAYTMYMREISEIRAENIRQDARGSTSETLMVALKDRVTRVESELTASKSDRDLLIRMDTRLQQIERSLNRDGRP